jgi:hypothetical protein
MAAARGELWLDEIWSFRLAGLQSGPFAVITAIHHDNNHHLNSLYLYFVRESGSWILYRLHVIAAGTATVILAGIITKRAGDRAAVAAMLLSAASFPLVLYSTEARGYALAVFFAFLAIPLADRYFVVGRAVWAVAFGVVSVLGLLSQLTFLHAYAGFVVWTAYRVGLRPLRRAVTAFASFHAVPIVSLTALYWIDLRHMVVGGGPNLAASTVAARTLSLALGGPDDGPFRAVVVAAAIVLTAASILEVRRSGSHMWVLFLVTIVVAPAVTFTFGGSHLLYERYFLVSMAFLLLASGWTAAAMARRSLPVAVVAAAAFMIGNGARTAGLVRDGRGSYTPALTHIADRAVQHPVTVGGDHDFRQGRLVEFYRRFVPAGQDIEYHQLFEWAVAGPEWYLVHSQEPGFQPVSDLALEGGRRYILSVAYRHSGPSGWSLAVYHNALAEGR